MSQITCCPNCSTSFRVTDAQLAAHLGKVRCGRCSFVFHAPDFLQDLTYQVEDIETEPLGIQSPAIAPPASVTQQASIDSAPTVATAPFVPPSLPEPSVAHTEQTIGIATQPSQEKAYNEIPTDTPQISLDEERTAVHPQIEIDSESEYQPILSDDDLFQTVSTRSRWSWLWTCGAAIALCFLLLQLLYVFRLQLAQDFPALRPKMLVLCQTLRCTMPLPQQAHLLRSEYSELTFIPNSAQLIQLNATLRNLAPFEQALPKLELTLTDDHEQVVLRKVFTAAQYLPQAQLTSIESNEEIRAFIQLDLGELHSTGYSLYWFY